MADLIGGSARTLLTTSEATIFTTDGSLSTVLVEIDLANTSATDATARISIGADSATTRIIPDMTVPANGKIQWKGQLPVGTSVNIRGSAATTNVVNVGITVVTS